MVKLSVSPVSSQNGLDLVEINLLSEGDHVGVTTITQSFTLLALILLLDRPRRLIQHLLAHTAPEIDKLVLAKKFIEFSPSLSLSATAPSSEALLEGLGVEAESGYEWIVCDGRIDGFERRAELWGVGSEQFRQGIALVCSQSSDVILKDASLVTRAQCGMSKPSILLQDG